MSATFRLEREKSVLVVPLVPMVIAWLRHSAPQRAADMFLNEATGVSDEEVADAWGEVVDVRFELNLLP